MKLIIEITQLCYFRPKPVNMNRLAISTIPFSFQCSCCNRGFS